MEATDTPDERHGPGGLPGHVVGGRLQRRRFLIGSAAGAAAGWVIPSMISVDAAAAGSVKTTPGFITKAEAYHQVFPSSPYVRTITLTTSGVKVGDLWLALVAYHVNGTIGGLPGVPAQVWGPVDRNSGTAVWPAANNVYSIRAYLIARVLTASDISGGNHTATFTTGSDSQDYGGLRGVAVVYRGTDPLSLPSVTSTSGFGPVGSGDIVTSTFPTASPVPALPNRVVRLGVARGYGGWNALYGAINWTGGPGTNRSNFDGTNWGDRRIWISDEPDSTGATTTGTWYKQPNGALGLAPYTQNWVTFTAAVVP